jgi:Uma2 family endonuclease
MGFAASGFQRVASIPDEDHIIHFDGVSWEDYERLLAMRGDCSAPRITYLEGLVEIMAPSRSHESIRSFLGRLLETWLVEKDIEFTTLGSWTLKRRKDERGAEADECYVFGPDPDEDQYPDLAIEVVWTHGRIDKLEVYRKLGVREVWYWRDGSLQPYALRGQRYEPIEGSEVLPRLDLGQFVSFMDRPTTSAAIRDYRAALGG